MAPVEGIHIMKRRLALVILLAPLIAGCIGSPTRPSTFYVLSPDEAAPLAGRSVPAAPLSIGLGPIDLPELFDRPQIVTRPEPNRIDLAEFDRWGGDLSKDLGRVLAQDLMARLDTDAVLIHPWSSRHALDYEVSMRFFRFDGVLDDSARVEGVWRLVDGREGCELAVRRFRIDQPVPAPGYAGLVEAISSAVAHLSDEVAAAIVSAPKGC
jgi:hypothetical protein